MADFLVRRAEVSELSALVALSDAVDAFHQSALPWLLQATGPEETERSLRPFLEQPDHVALVAAAGDALRGVVLVRLRELSGHAMVRPQRAAEIEMLVVEQRWRRHGVGRALVAAALSWARDAGAATTQLGVYEFNDAARRFWECVGFTTLSRRLILHLE